MSGFPEQPFDADERLRSKLKLARMEADLAYFQARIEILGEPATANQEAQRTVFTLLRDAIGRDILRQRRRLGAARLRR